MPDSFAFGSTPSRLPSATTPEGSEMKRKRAHRVVQSSARTVRCAAPTEAARHFADAPIAPTPAWAARESSMHRGTQTRDYYQSEPRQVHVLGSLALQTEDCLFLSFTGDWSWADGAGIVRMMTGHLWDDVIPAGVRILVLYAVGDHAFPSSYVFTPSAFLRRREPEEDCEWEWDFPELLDGPCMPRDWLQQVDWTPCATVAGERFMAEGLAAFYPELVPWAGKSEDAG